MNEPITYSNPETSKTVFNWPFGRDRATAYFYVENHPTRGQRACRRIVDPLTGKTFNPKKLTYAAQVRIVDGSDRRTYIIELTRYGGFISVMKGDCKFQHESIFPDNPRFAEVMALFAQEEVAP